MNKSIIPDCKIADNDALLRLVLQSATCISQISSMVLSKWLLDSNEIISDQNLMKQVGKHWKVITLFIFSANLKLKRIKLLSY